MAGPVETDVSPLQPKLLFRRTVPVMGPFETVSLHLENPLLQIGSLGLLKVWVSLQDFRPHVLQEGGGRVVEPTAVGEAVQIDFKIHAGIVGSVHAPAPFENNPHVVPIQGGVFGVASVPPNAADGPVHPRLCGEVRIQFQHGGGQVQHQLAQRGDHIGLVLLFVLPKPGAAVVQPVFKEKIQGFLGKWGVHIHSFPVKRGLPHQAAAPSVFAGNRRELRCVFLGL